MLEFALQKMHASSSGARTSKEIADLTVAAADRLASDGFEGFDRVLLSAFQRSQHRETKELSASYRRSEQAFHGVATSKDIADLNVLVLRHAVRARLDGVKPEV